MLEIALSNAFMAVVVALVAAWVAGRKSHPALAHTLWLLVFIKLLTPPLVVIPVPFLSAGEDTRAVAAVELDGGRDRPLQAELDRQFVESQHDLPNLGPPDSRLLPGSENTLPRAPSARETASPSGPPPSAGAVRVESAPAEQSWFWAVLGVRGLVAVIWIGGSLLWLGVAVSQARRICRVLAFARPAPRELVEEVRQLAGRLNLPRCPKVYVASGPISPMVWPIGRQVRILLPTELLDQLSPEERSTVLVHELAHVRRRDHLVRFVEFVGMVLYWWHPVVWWARARLRRAEEECCDAWVVNTLPNSAQTYAAALLKAVDVFSQLSNRHPILDPMGNAAATTTRLLERRLTMIFRQATPLHLGRAWGVFLLLLAALVLPIVPGRASRATASQNATAEPETSEASIQADASAPADESADAPNNDSSQNANEGLPFRLFDPFAGKLGLGWKPVRPDPSHVSLTSTPGKLTITTQPGSIYGDELDVEHAVAAKNIYLIPNPAPGNAGFVVTTCIESFHPKKPYQQAGLIVYNDDDNYLKWVMEFARYAPSFTFIHETNRSTVGDYNAVRNEPNLDRFWLRIMKRGSFYQYAYSIDGEEFTVVDEIAWGGRAPRFIGILAKNDRVPDEIDAIFDFLEVRSLTPEEKNEPAFQERQKLQGMWDVVSCKSDGKLLEELPLSRLAFDGSHLTVTEAENSLQTEYTVEVTDGRKELVLRSGLFPRSRGSARGWEELLLRSGLFGQSRGSVRALYRLEDNTLVLGVDARPGAPAPKELETREGDKRLLLKLKRTPADVASAIRRNALSAKDFFLRLDANHDGHLTLEEFTADWATPVAVGRATEVFRLADRDKNGRVTFDEYQKKPNKAAFLLLDVDLDDRLTLSEASSGTPVKTVLPGRARAVFELIDKDDDGTLTLEEYTTRPPEFQFVKLDRNDDGRLSFSEYSAGNQRLVRTSRIRRVFAALDRNGDGNLSLEEFTDKPQVALFGRLDADADGKLSLQEFTNPRRTPEQVVAAKKGFAQKDSDGDGSLSFKEYAFRGEDDEFWKADKNGDNRLNREEFEVSQIWRVAGDPQAAFRSLDRNRDENICLNEFRNRPDSTRPNAANDP